MAESSGEVDQPARQRIRLGDRLIYYLIYIHTINSIYIHTIYPVIYPGGVETGHVPVGDKARPVSTIS